MEKKNKGKNIVISFVNIGLFYTLPILFSSLIAKYIINSSNMVKDIALFIIDILVLSVLIICNFDLLKKDFIKFKKDYKKCLDTGFKYYVLGLILMFISNFIIISINGGNIANNEELNRSVIGLYPLYAISSIILLGPITEEITFRGGFKKAIGNIVLYTVFTGILFGSAHIIGNVNTFTDVLFIIPYSILGLMFSYVCYKTNNIFTSISMHIVHNSFALLMIFLGGIL